MKRVALFILGLVGAAGAAQGLTAQEVRRVVTGHSSDGRAVVVDDGPPSTSITFESLPGLELVPLWATTDEAMVRGAAEGPLVISNQFLPAQGETRFLIFRLPSAAEVASAMKRGHTPEAFQQEFAAKVPDLAQAYSDPQNPGMHATETVDYVIVLTGEVILELDDGAHVRLSKGDLVIQNGTRHAWHNVGQEEAVLAAVMVGIKPQDPEDGFGG